VIPSGVVVWDSPPTALGVQCGQQGFDGPVVSVEFGSRGGLVPLAVVLGGECVVFGEPYLVEELLHVWYVVLETVVRLWCGDAHDGAAKPSTTSVSRSISHTPGAGRARAVLVPRTPAPPAGTRGYSRAIDTPPVRRRPAHPSPYRASTAQPPGTYSS
jgi:hypothetical protein